jgi:hypothetical protein
MMNRTYYSLKPKGYPMDHEPFRIWLVDRSGLNSDENEILDDHLAACPECSAFAEKIRNLDVVLAATRQLTPSPGFTSRFLETLPERKEKEQQRQIRRWMIGLGIALVVNFSLIVAASVITRTTSTWLVNLAILYGNMDGFFQEIASFFQAVSLVIPATYWVVFILVALGWAVAGLGIYLFAIRRIHRLGDTHAD